MLKYLSGTGWKQGPKLSPLPATDLHGVQWGQCVFNWLLLTSLGVPLANTAAVSDKMPGVKPPCQSMITWWALRTARSRSDRRKEGSPGDGRTRTHARSISIMNSMFTVHPHLSASFIVRPCQGWSTHPRLGFHSSNRAVIIVLLQYFWTGRTFEKLNT